MIDRPKYMLKNHSLRWTIFICFIYS